MLDTFASLRNVILLKIEYSALNISNVVQSAVMTIIKGASFAKCNAKVVKGDMKVEEAPGLDERQ